MAGCGAAPTGTRARDRNAPADEEDREPADGVEDEWFAVITITASVMNG